MLKGGGGEGGGGRAKNVIFHDKGVKGVNDNGASGGQTKSHGSQT